MPTITTTRTATFTDTTHTGLRWEVDASAPLPRDVEPGSMLSKDAAKLARRLRRAGWRVTVATSGPGSAAIGA